MRKRGLNYSLEERLMIIKEYETSSMSAAEVAKKYGFHSPSIIAVWRNRYVNSKKSINFAAENDTNVVEETCMVDKSKAELEAELAKVKKELELSFPEKSRHYYPQPPTTGTRSLWNARSANGTPRSAIPLL